MKQVFLSRRGFIRAALGAAAGAAWLPAAVAKPGARRTVLDYFQLLPARYFQVGDRKAFLMQKGRSVVDIPNDYINMGGDGAQSTLIVAVFRHRGRDLIAVQEYPEGEEAVVFRLRFYRYEGGRWKDVTRAVSPAEPDRYADCELPRYGTTIRLRDREGRVAMNWLWKDGRFVVRLPS